MVKPVRLQLSRRKGFNLQALSRETNGLEAISVTRPSKWGNPFRSSAYTQQECVALFRTAAQGAMPIRFAAGLVRSPAIIELAKEQVSRLSALPFAELAGKNLACFCRLDQPCHADILLELACASPISGRPPPGQGNVNG